jgi:hypothetical protein
LIVAPLPDVIGRYQDAHDRHDTAVALSAFTLDARPGGEVVLRDEFVLTGDLISELTIGP